MAQTVYVVTDGCYSDYRIQGVFSSPQTAQEYIEKHGGDIEEYVLDQENLKQELLTWSVWIRVEDGEIYHRKEQKAWVISSRAAEYVTIKRESDGASHIMVTSQVSEEHAVKCAVEKRQEILRKSLEAPGMEGVK